MTDLTFATVGAAEHSGPDGGILLAVRVDLDGVTDATLPGALVDLGAALVAELQEHLAEREGVRVAVVVAWGPGTSGIVRRTLTTAVRGLALSIGEELSPGVLLNVVVAGTADATPSLDYLASGQGGHTTMTTLEVQVP